MIDCRDSKRVLLTGVLTTGMCAKVVPCAPRTVVKWIDSGRLKAFKLPGSHARRIRLADFREFLSANNLAVPDWLQALPNVAFGFNGETPQGWVAAATSFELGLAVAGLWGVGAFVASDACGLTDAIDVCRWCKGKHSASRTHLVASDDVPDQRIAGVDVLLRRPVDWAKLAGGV